MPEHLTTDELAAFARRELSGARLIAADAHISGCEACRAAAAAAGDAGGRVASLREELAGADHLAYEELAGWADGSLLPADRDRVALHIGACADCRAEAADMVALRDRAEAVRMFLPVARGRRPASRWAFTGPLAGAAAATAVTLALLLPGRLDVPSAFVSLRLPTGDIGQGDALVASVIPLDGPHGGTSPQTKALKVSNDGYSEPLRIRPGKAAVLAQFAGAGGSPQLYAQVGELGAGRNVVTPVAANCFDDVKVYSGNRILIDETFDGYPDGTTRPRSLRMVTPGAGGFVTRSLQVPATHGACWVNMALPLRARNDAFDLPRSRVAGLPTLTFEVRVFVTDPSQAVKVGLMRFDGNSTAEIGVVRFSYGKVSARHNGDQFESLQVRHWYKLRVDCDLKRDTMTVFVDGRRLWTDVPFDASLGTDFTVLALSGETRPYQPDGSPAPPMDPANPALDAEHTCFLDETRAIHLHNTDTAIARPWLVTASGEMRIGKDPRSAPIDSVVIWYIKPGGAMGYATVPIGGSRFILGRSLNAFVVETDPRDNVGKVTVTAHSFPTR